MVRCVVGRGYPAGIAWARYSTASVAGIWTVFQGNAREVDPADEVLQGNLECKRDTRHRPQVRHAAARFDTPDECTRRAGPPRELGDGQIGCFPMARHAEPEARGEQRIARIVVILGHNSPIAPGVIELDRGSTGFSRSFGMAPVNLTSDSTNPDR